LCLTDGVYVLCMELRSEYQPGEKRIYTISQSFSSATLRSLDSDCAIHCLFHPLCVGYISELITGMLRRRSYCKSRSHMDFWSRLETSHCDHGPDQCQCELNEWC